MNIVCFHNPDEDNGYLSNWYPSSFTVDSVAFSSMEQFMMYRKAICFGDEAVAAQILSTSDVAKIKSLGRQVSNYDESMWNGIRQIVVYEGLLAKFSQNEELKAKLKATGNAVLAECAVKDRIWGIGLSMKDPDRLNKAKWNGQNLLGYALMMVRERLQQDYSWEQRKAKELFVSTADKGYPELPVLSATQDRGMIRRDENSINIFHDKKNEAGYKRVLPGQFVIHLRSFQGGFAHSAIEGITSPAYTVFGFSELEKHDSEYWKYVFTSKSFIRRLETVTYGIRDGRSISYEEFLTLDFVYPSKAEQTAIARYLDKLSNLITLHQCE